MFFEVSFFYLGLSIEFDFVYESYYDYAMASHQSVKIKEIHLFKHIIQFLQIFSNYVIMRSLHQLYAQCSLWEKLEELCICAFAMPNRLAVHNIISRTSTEYYDFFCQIE